MQNEEAVNSILKTVIFDLYAKGAEFPAAEANILAVANSTKDSIDEFLQQAVLQGVPIEAATTCVILFLKLKISQDAS